MTIELTPEQKEAVRHGEAVEVQDPETGKGMVLLLADEYHKLIQIAREEAEDYKFQQGWIKLAQRAVAQALNDETR